MTFLENKWKTYSRFLKLYPWKSSLLITCLILAGILEGIGISTLFPLISILVGGETDHSIIARISGSLFSFLQLDLNILNILILFCGTILIKTTIFCVAMTTMAFISSRIAADLRHAYIKKILRAKWPYLSKIRHGESAAALGIESQKTATAFNHACKTLALIFIALSYVGLSFLISWKIAVIAIPLAFFIVFFFKPLISATRRAGREQNAKIHHILNLINDLLQAVKCLKAMNRTQHLHSHIDKAIETLQKAEFRSTLLEHYLWILPEALTLVIICLGFYISLHYSLMPIEQTLFMAVLILRLIMRISAAQRTFQIMAANEDALSSFFHKIDAADNARDNINGTYQATLQKNITLRHIHYACGGHQILRDFNLIIESGSFCLVHGASGSGKTTLIDLVTGLLTPDRGIVSIDGIPLESVDQERWRDSIGYIPQDISLFHDTIMNNITLGDGSVSAEDVIDALKNSELFEYIDHLEKNMDTIIQGHGSNLSGGQRQRIAIARALIKKPRLLIMDEATSALDPQTAENIMHTISRMRGRMTILAISHDMSFAKYADRVIHINPTSQPAAESGFF